MTSTLEAASARGPLHTLDRWAGIRSGERKLAYGAFATQLLIGAGHAELETARDTVFLTKLSPAQLPFMYLAVALLGFLMTEVNRRSMLRQRTRTGLTGFLVLGGLISAGFAFLAPTTTTIYALYLWTALCGPWAVLQFSLQLAAELSVGQAKRLLGFVGAGAVLGAVVGSALARVLLEFASSRGLMVSGGLFFVLAGLGPSRMAVVDQPTERGQRREAYRTTRTEATSVLRDGYGRGLLLLMLSSTIALTLSDFVFKAEASRALADPHRLAEFLSTTQLLTNLVSFVVQVFAVAGILRVLGAHGALLLLPTFLLGGTAVYGVGLAFLGSLLLRGADGSLRYSVHRTAIDILYFPLPDSARRRMKPVLEIMGQRGGQAIAALFLLLLAWLPLAESEQRILLVGAMGALLLMWGVCAVRLRRPYVELFKSSLAHNHHLTTDLTDRELALPVLEAAVAALNSQSPGEVMAALGLLSTYRHGRLLPALILYHPEPKVLVRALELLAHVRRTDVIPLVDRLLSHGDIEVRTGALRARIRLQPDREVLRRFTESTSQPELGATALVGLLSRGWIADDEARQLVAGWVAEERRGFVRPLAQAALVVPGTPTLASILGECLTAARTQGEQAEVAAALAKNPCPSSQRSLVALLAYRVPRDSVREALVALGPIALEELAARLQDPSTPHSVRRHLPETIRRFPVQSAADVLMKQLVRENDGMVRFKLLRSLNRLRRTNPELPLDPEVIGRLLESTLASVSRSIQWREALRAEFEPKPTQDSSAGPPSTRFTFLSASLELLIEVLYDKEAHATDRVLRLCNLLLPREDFRPIAVGLRSRVPARRASAFEVLSSSLPLRFREAVLDIVRYTFGTRDEAELEAQAAQPFTDESLSGEEALRAMVHEEGATLRALALNAAAEIGYGWVEDAFANERTPHDKPSALKLYEAAKAMHAVSSRPSLPRGVDSSRRDLDSHDRLEPEPG